MAEKVLNRKGSGYMDWVANGIINATDAGADIISMSLGANVHSETLHEAIRYAYDDGVLLVAAAGNDATHQKHYPAAYGEVIAVAATDQSDNPTEWDTSWGSNFGNWIELAAPGDEIYSTLPNDTYASWSGTSMACPHVAGLAALVWSRYPNLTRDSVRYWLRYASDDLGLAGFDLFYGYGRINAHTAVKTDPPNYDLVALDLDVPPTVEANTSRVIRGTVLNLGKRNQSNVEVHLLENSEYVDNIIIGGLPRGNSSIVSFSWTPTDGEYNLTLYVEPEDSEFDEILENSHKSKNVTARFPTTLHVPSNYSSMQAALHETIPGDTVSVSAGTYNEVIILDKANVKLVGESNGSTTIKGRGHAPVIGVKADNVTVSSFSIRGRYIIHPITGLPEGSTSCIEIEGVSNINVSFNNIMEAIRGMEVHSSSNVTIKGSYVAENEFGGIFAINLNNSVIRRNTITEHRIPRDYNYIWDKFGLHITESFGNNITGNNISLNEIGVSLGSSFRDNIVSYNNISNNQLQGIYLSGDNNTLNNNEVVQNGWEPEVSPAQRPPLGFRLSNSRGNTMRSNLIRNNTVNFGVVGDSLEDFVQDIDSSNTIDHKPIYYWVDRQDEQFPWWNVGYMALVNCRNITVTDLMLSKNNYQGILLAYTMNSLVMNSEITDNKVGIDLLNSSANILAGNSIVANDIYGIRLRDSSNNEIFHNTVSQSLHGLGTDNSSSNKISHNSFINNDNHVLSHVSMNVWDSGYPLAGNYWDDYNGNDTLSGPNQDQPGSDGIGDTPYTIDDDNQDRYPFMNGVTHDLERDVAITNLTTNATHVTPGRTVQITVAVQNQGHHFNETFNVTAYAYNTTQALNYTVGTQNITALAPLSNETLAFNWNTTSATQNITYTIKAEATIVPDETDTADNTYIDGTVLVRLNDPPSAPQQPDGEQTGTAGQTYTYNTTTTDPNGDQIWYEFNWSDGTTDTVGPYNSSETGYALHSWTYAGTYDVKVRAKDIFNEWSNWSQPLEVTINSPNGGGCPFIYSWNGTDYVIENNLLPRSAQSNGTEVEDYYRLEQNLAPIYEDSYHSYYSLLISEFQQEHSYLDQVQLYAVDHESDVNVAVTPTGQILTYQNPYAPLSAIDEEGSSWLQELNDINGNYYEGYNSSYLILNFGEVTAQDAKLVMRADRPPTKKSIHIQVLNTAGNWTNVVSIIPRTYWATEIVNLSSHLPPTGEFKVRLYFTDSHKIDFVGLDTTPQAQIDLKQTSLLLAYHSTEGNVTTQLQSDDDAYAELLPEQQIALLFAATTQDGDQRTFIIYVKGYYYTITS